MGFPGGLGRWGPAFRPIGDVRLLHAAAFRPLCDLALRERLASPDYEARHDRPDYFFLSLSASAIAIASAAPAAMTGMGIMSTSGSVETVGCPIHRLTGRTS